MAEKVKKPQVTKFILLILLIAGAAALYWIFLLNPALAKIGDLREANMSEEQEIAALETKLAQKEEIEHLWEIAREKESYLRSKVPEEADLPGVWGALEGVIFSTAGEVEELNAYEFEDVDKYRFIPVTLKVKGAVNDLLVLLEKIEQFAHKTLSGHVRLEDTKEDGKHRLTVDFDLIFNLEGQDKAMGVEEEQG